MAHTSKAKGFVFVIRGKKKDIFRLVEKE